MMSRIIHTESVLHGSVTGLPADCITVSGSGFSGHIRMNDDELLKFTNPAAAVRTFKT